MYSLVVFGPNELIMLNSDDECISPDCPQGIRYIIRLL